MKNKMIVSASPFVTKAGKTTRRIMLDVIIALTPLMVCAVVFFGAISLALIAICVVSAVLSELVYNILYALAKGKKVNRELLLTGSHTDCSAIVTGILLALNLPAAFPLWAAILGAIFAIIIVKMLFGGIGRNFANPALAARIFLFISFASFFGNSSNVIYDGTAGATWLGGRDYNILFGFSGTRAPGATYIADMFFGIKNAAAIGEVCAIAILAGLVYLVVRKVVDPKLPLYIILATFIFALLFDGLPSIKSAGALNALVMLPLAHVLSGGLLLGAVFMATDYATSPNTEMGTLIYGVGIALLTVVLRVFASLPEGVSFAILIMNIFVPLIDKLVYPKAFGKAKARAEAKAAAIAAKESEVKK